MPALKKILCALDLSDQSESVAEYAVMLAKMSGASIVAVYAAPTLTQYTGFHVPPNTIDNFVGEIVSGAGAVQSDSVTGEEFTDFRNLSGCGIGLYPNTSPAWMPAALSSSATRLKKSLPSPKANRPTSSLWVPADARAST